MSWMGSYWFLRLDFIFSLNVDGVVLTNARSSGSDPIQQPFMGKWIGMNHQMAQESKEEQLVIDFPGNMMYPQQMCVHALSTTWKPIYSARHN